MAMNERKSTLGDAASMRNTVSYLRSKERILFLTTSNRWHGEKGGEIPKSTLLARRMAELVGNDTVTVLDVPSLRIVPCEGNVSTKRGNTCGQKEAVLDDPHKNPSGCHRCWASINSPDDELWKISRELFRSDAVIFFGSVRWGQMNAEYQKLIERLTWIENRHSTLSEENMVAHIDAGIIAIGHNWRGAEVVQIQKEVYGYFGFRVPDELSWHWQFTDESSEESDRSYVNAAEAFRDAFLSDESLS